MATLGDYNYREFYKDLGYEADFEYIPYIAHNGARIDTGIKILSYNIKRIIIKITIMYNGLKIQLKNKLVTFWIAEYNKLMIYLNLWIPLLLLFVHMMQNFMVTGGMKVHTGYIFCLKKSIMINVILN